MFLSFAMNQVYASDVNNMRFKVLENTSYDDCLYSGNAAIKVRYKKKHFHTDRARLVVLASLDGLSHLELYSREVEAGRGRSVLNFEAGECVKNLKVELDPVY